MQRPRQPLGIPHEVKDESVKSRLSEDCSKFLRQTQRITRPSTVWIKLLTHFLTEVLPERRSFGVIGCKSGVNTKSSADHDGRATGLASLPQGAGDLLYCRKVCELLDIAHFVGTLAFFANAKSLAASCLASAIGSRVLRNKR